MIKIYRNTESDIETIFKISRELERTSKANKEYKANLFKQIFEEIEYIEIKKDGKITKEIRSLTEKEILGKLIELCMEADYLRKLPPNLINSLHSDIEAIEIMKDQTEDLSGLINTRKSAFRKKIRYIANVAYSKPNPPALDLQALAKLKTEKRELIG